jgi:hypothetical protein
MATNQIPEMILKFGDAMGENIAARREKTEIQDIIDFSRDKDLTPATFQEYRSLHPNANMLTFLKLAPVVSGIKTRQDALDFGKTLMSAHQNNEINGPKDIERMMAEFKGSQEGAAKGAQLFTEMLKNHKDLFEPKAESFNRTDRVRTKNAQGGYDPVPGLEDLPEKPAKENAVDMHKIDADGSVITIKVMPGDVSKRMNEGYREGEYKAGPVKKEPAELTTDKFTAQALEKANKGEPLTKVQQSLVDKATRAPREPVDPSIAWDRREAIQDKKDAIKDRNDTIKIRNDEINAYKKEKAALNKQWDDSYSDKSGVPPMKPAEYSERLQAIYADHPKLWDKGGQTAPAKSAAGKVLNATTAQQYLVKAGGDKNKARELARKDGYTF